MAAQTFSKNRKKNTVALMCSSRAILSLGACMPPPDLVNKVQCILERSVFSRSTVFHLKAWGYNHPVSASHTAGISQTTWKGGLSDHRSLCIGHSNCAMFWRGSVQVLYTVLWHDIWHFVPKLHAHAKCMKMCTHVLHFNLHEFHF